jgi:hypothetical protein
MDQNKKVIFIVVGLVIAYIAVDKFLSNPGTSFVEKLNNNSESSNTSSANNGESNGESLVSHCAKKITNSIQYKRCKVTEGESEVCMKMGRDIMNLCMAGL